MKTNLQTIVTALRRIQNEGGDSNFVIFNADSEKNYYIQFASEQGSKELDAEAVSNNYLEPPFALSKERTLCLEELGWNSPHDKDSNFSRTWVAEYDETRLLIAQVVMRTFVEIYGMPPEQSLSVNLCLE